MMPSANAGLARRQLVASPSLPVLVQAEPKVVRSVSAAFPYETQARDDFSLEEAIEFNLDKGYLPGRGTADAARDKVSTLHQKMMEVAHTISMLQDENEMLKLKLLGCRKQVLEKYFTTDGRLLLQMVVQEWQRVCDYLRRMREYDGAESMRAQNRQMCEAKVVDLERIVASETASAVEAELELRDLRTKVERAEATIRTIASSVTAYQNPQAPRISPFDAAAYLRSRLGDVMRDLDARPTQVIAPPPMEASKQVLYVQPPVPQPAPHQAGSMQVPPPAQAAGLTGSTSRAQSSRMGVQQVQVSPKRLR